MAQRFTETEILLAIMDGRNADAVELIETLYPNEQRGLRKQFEFGVLLLQEAEQHEQHRHAIREAFQPDE